MQTMSKVEIAVSPHYRGRGWTDRGTGFEFNPQVSGTLKTRSFNKKDYEDLSGLKNSLRLNHLLLLQGDLKDVKEEKPKKLNPEELTGEELDKLLSGGQDQGALVKENQTLVKENQKLEKQNLELLSELKELKEKADDFERNKDGSINKKALSDGNTRNELVEIAKKYKIEVDKADTKADIVDLIVEKAQ